jgi:pimeloyl-ACP methyl ester carboxylesterase
MFMTFPAAARHRLWGAPMRFIQANGIQLRIAEEGRGPLVVLLHGWPESWYSWRHQLPALAAAGYHAVAPDMRGYGQSDKPANVEAYDIHQLTADVVGILDAMEERTAVVVGHDWGAMVAWHCLLLHPARFTAVVAMSVPFFGRPAMSPIESLRQAFGENFFYMLYFQEPDVPEAEFDADPAALLRRLYVSPGVPLDPPPITDRHRSAGGFVRRRGTPRTLPAWLTQSDFDYYVNEFTHAGFRGGINYYRNFHRNWETTAAFAGARIEQPALFVAGDQDVVITRATAEQLTTRMLPAVPDLRGVILLPDTGHWVQQERPAETNAAMLQFLRGLGA